MTQNHDNESVRLLAKWQAGDSRAADEIYDRYVTRLIALASSFLSSKFKRRISPEDVVQSAYRSFFRKSRAGEFELRRSGDLWRLLAAITLSKTRGQVEHHQAKKRHIDREVSAASTALQLGVVPEAVAREPSPEESMALAEILNQFMCSLDEDEREILAMRLQEQSTSEIAKQIKLAPRSVRRVLEKLEARLRALLSS